MHRGAHLLALLVFLWCSGCSSFRTQSEFSLYNSSSSEQSTVWPKASQSPKIKYLGELLGEQNLISSTSSRFIERSQWLIKKLVGLGRYHQSQTILQRPQSGAVDQAGNIYVTDVSRQAVYRFSPVQKTLEVWEYADKNLRFVSPIGIAIGLEGDLWIADSTLGFIVHLSASGEPLGIIGENVLRRPTGLALDSKRQWLYVSDTAENTIKIIDFNGKLIRSIGKKGDAEGDLNGPTYLTYAKDKLYVSDTLNARIQIFSPEGVFLQAIGQRGLYLGDMTRPKGIAVDTKENVYVVESFYDYLLIFNKQGDFLLPLGGSGKGIGQFYLPAGVWTDANNRIYVADMFNGRVVVFQLLA